jgi:hypothetical protein
VIPIAVNLLNVASVVLRSVGGEGRIAVVYDLDGGAIGTVGGNEIDVVKSALENLETAAGSLLLDLLDVTKSDEDFRKALFEFSSLAIELRVSRVEEHKNFMAMLEAMSEALSGKTEEKITLSDAQTSEDQQ